MMARAFSPSSFSNQFLGLRPRLVWFAPLALVARTAGASIGGRYLVLRLRLGLHTRLDIEAKIKSKTWTVAYELYNRINIHPASIPSRLRPFHPFPTKTRREFRQQFTHCFPTRSEPLCNTSFRYIGDPAQDGRPNPGTLLMSGARRAPKVFGQGVLDGKNRFF